MEWHTEVVAHPERHEHGARKLDVLGDVARDTDRHCRDAAPLDRSLYQSDRLVADRSGRRKQGEVCHLVAHGVRDVFCERALEKLGIHVVADEREEASCQIANHAFGA